MTNLIFRWVFDWLIGWGGLSLIVALCAAAVWWFIPAIFTKVRALAFNVALGALAFNFIYTMGYQHGASETRAAWAAAVERAAEQGVDDRAQAERDTPAIEPAPPEPIAPAPVGTPATCPAPVPAPPRARNDGVLRGDPFNRERVRR